MDLQLDDKLALVTASTGGIGKEIAATLALEGARVIINGRSEKTVEAAIAEIRAQVPKARLEQLVADNGTAAGVAESIRLFPAVDILVNNLGIYEAVNFFEIDDAQWQRMFEIDVMSGVRLARHYMRNMIEDGAGRVSFLASEAALMPAPEMVHYSAAKTMLLSVSRSLAELTKGTNVTVNAIVAGSTKTEGNVTFIESLYPGLTFDEAEARFMGEGSARSTSLIQRLITPREVADFVAYISSPLAAAINGAALRVDGGLVRSVF